jgi:hypothetical protein
MSEYQSWSASYWEERYSNGGNSGFGSRGELACYKASIVNSIATRLSAERAIEFGCGDGFQLGLFRFHSYLGFDPSSSAVHKCRELYAADSSKRFELLESYGGEQADMTLSLDVIYHLVEDDVFDLHMSSLFRAALKAVVIYSSDFDSPRIGHQRHRTFQRSIKAREPGWKLLEIQRNLHPYDPKTGKGSLASFYTYVPA